MPLTERDNCSRVIRYVVTYGARYGSDVLVQMRVHDFNVLTDLDALNPLDPDPEEPVESDGTPSGVKPCDGATSFVDMLVDMAGAGTSCWWTGWWPMLHSRTTGTLVSGAVYAYQVGVDLLGAFVLEEFVMNTPVDNELTEDQISMLASGGFTEFLAMAFPIDAVAILAAVVLMGLIDILLDGLTKLPTPTQMVALVLLIVAYTAAMLYGFYLIWDAVLTRRMPSYAAFGLLFAVLVALFFEERAAINSGMKIMEDWWGRYKAGTSRAILAKRFCLVSWLIVGLKAIFIGICLAMMIRCWELWVTGYY